jgi:ABC-type multidrug transport system fused ATPase/permease subunit
MWDCLSEVHGNIGIVAKGFEYLDLIEENRTVNPGSLKVKGIECKNISFTYPLSNHKAVDNITISLKNGEITAIVGHNGSGKTTLIKLLLGLFEPDVGKIIYNDADISSVIPSALYKDVSAVFQDFNHYYLTIRENIGISDTMHINNTEKIIEACTKAGDFDFIASLPNGIDTPLGKEYGGSELSGGQWQQLALSRGYFKGGSFIVLDEPASSLDPFKESQIYENFKRLCYDKIGIIITHRLGAATLADKILLMENGQIIEQGSHSELCAIKGNYWNMFKAQAGLYNSD